MRLHSDLVPGIWLLSRHHLSSDEPSPDPNIWTPLGPQGPRYPLKMETAPYRRPHLSDETVLEAGKKSQKEVLFEIQIQVNVWISPTTMKKEDLSAIGTWATSMVTNGGESKDDRSRIINTVEAAKIYNDPSHYQPESPEENESHENESDEVWILPNGTIIRRIGP